MKPPPGRAVISCVGVVSDATVTGCPPRLARVAAASMAIRWTWTSLGTPESPGSPFGCGGVARAGAGLPEDDAADSPAPGAAGGGAASAAGCALTGRQAPASIAPAAIPGRSRFIHRERGPLVIVIGAFRWSGSAICVHEHCR